MTEGKDSVSDIYKGLFLHVAKGLGTVLAIFYPIALAFQALLGGLNADLWKYALIGAALAVALILLCSALVSLIIMVNYWVMARRRGMKLLELASLPAGEQVDMMKEDANPEDPIAARVISDLEELIDEDPA